MKRGGALAVLGALGSCRPHAAPPPTATSIQSCHYAVSLGAEGVVDVDASCKASGELSFRVAERILRAHVGAPKPSKTGSFSSVQRHLSYRVDLAALAAEHGGFDSAERVGDSFIAAMSSVLLVPEPLTTEIPVTVSITAPAEMQVATGLMRDGASGGYRLLAHEIPVATYVAFGKLEQRQLDIAGASVEVVRLDRPMDASFDEVNTWITASAKAVRDFYGVFPVPRASVMVIPTPRRDAVVFGKVLPESEPGIALLLGEHVSHRAMYSDWILVHELFHLGFPSFFGEGKWLDEGLATYYEPIIRVRAGLYSERELWDELEKSMPQGLPAFTSYGLEKADDFRGIYWGGAIACLLADVTARRRDPKRGLEVGLRALREAGGNASEVWSLADAVATVDHALGAPTLAPIVTQHGSHGSAFDLDALMRDLGVTRKPDQSLELSDSAPLAAIRRAIVHQP